MPIRLHDPDSPGHTDAARSVRDVIDLYLTHELPPRERPFDDRRHVLEAFAKDCGDLPLDEAKPHTLRMWILARASWKSDWTRRRAAGTVRACFNWAAKLEFIATNPFSGVTFPHGERGTPLDAQEFQAMLRASSAVFRRLLLALRFTGARPGELARAEWTHLDARRGCIVLHKHKTAKATGRPRIIVLHPVVLRLLDWIRRHGPNPRFIFTNSKGWNWTNPAIHWRIQQIRAAANVRPDVTCYGCRHAFCTDAVLAGVDIATVAALAGHSRISTTQSYFHVSGRTDHLRAAVEKVFTKPH